MVHIGFRMVSSGIRKYLHQLRPVVVPCSVSHFIHRYTLKSHVLRLIIPVVTTSCGIGFIMSLSGISSVNCFIFWLLFPVYIQ